MNEVVGEMKNIAATKVETTLEIPYLHAFLTRLLRGRDAAEGAEDLDFALLCGLRLNLLETMRYVHAQQPGLAHFEQWILERNGGSLEPAALDRLRRALDGEAVGSEVGSLDDIAGLTEAELAHWDEHGYVVLKGAATKDQARAAEQAVYEFLGASAAEPESWYRNQQGHSIWVYLLRHPAFWANRRSPRMVKAFSQLWGRAAGAKAIEDLWVNVDQGGLNPPERAGWPFPGPHLHWDTTLAAPHHFSVQGILYLADTAADQGAFSCVPGFQRELAPWLASLPAGTDARTEALRTLTMTPIAAEAGDMVLWHQSLPHGSSPNRSTRPRVAQYITMKPTRWPHHYVWL